MENLNEWLTVISLFLIIGCLWNLNNRIYRLSKQVEGLIAIEQGCDD